MFVPALRASNVCWRLTTTLRSWLLHHGPSGRSILTKIIRSDTSKEFGKVSIQTFRLTEGNLVSYSSQYRSQVVTYLICHYPISCNVDMLTLSSYCVIP